MLFIFQTDVRNNPFYKNIFDVADKMGIVYTTVDHSGDLVSFEESLKKKPVFVYGSVGLAKRASEMDWKPGSFYGEQHSYEKLYKGYGEQMLNPMPRFNKISDDIFEGASHLFIKPTRDAKVFTGKVFTEDEWIEFSQDLIKNPEHKWVDENTQIVSSESVDIIKEARFWIIEGKVISSSYYRFHGDLPFEDSVSEEALQYVRNITQQYQVGEAYVLDVALTWDGWRVVEANCINCAGFYNAEIGKIFEAIIAAFDF